MYMLILLRHYMYLLHDYNYLRINLKVSLTELSHRPIEIKATKQYVP